MAATCDRGPATGTRERVLHVAIVLVATEVELVAVADSEPQLFEELAAFVARRAEVVLWASHGARVHNLLEQGNIKSAVERYFARVGERWDCERLFIRTLTVRDDRSQ